MGERSGPRASLWSSTGVRAAFIWPALLAILFVSIFPLLVSLYISLSRLKLVRGGFEFRFIGLENFRELFVGGERSHFLGVTGPLTPLGWLVVGAGVALLAWGLVRARQGGASIPGMVFRLLGALLAAGALWLAAGTLLAEGGRPGTAVVTLIYVLVGIAVQFTLGLGLAWLLTQGLPGQRLFRVVFLLPMMITPVGVAYILTNGGPGTATESLSLHAYIRWRTLDLGQSAAVAYSLLFIVTVAALSYVNVVRRRVAEE